MWRDWEELSQQIGIILGALGLIISLLNFGFYFKFNEEQLKLQDDITDIQKRYFK